MRNQKLNWKRLFLILAMAGLTVYTLATLQGPHGVAALQKRLATIQVLHTQHADLVRETAEKRKRVDSLERGQNLDMEMRRYGRTLPGEVEYKVAEPKMAAPEEDSASVLAN